MLWRMFNEKGSRLYNLAFEYASGGCLHDLMEKYGGQIPERHIACYTRMIFKGLSSIHKIGLVHCDLKPENILVFPPKNCGLRELKIADFGLTKFPGENNRIGGLDSEELLFTCRRSRWQMGRLGQHCTYGHLDAWF